MPKKILATKIEILYKLQNYVFIYLFKYLFVNRVRSVRSATRRVQEKKDIFFFFMYITSQK
jgi:hypothetical protein